MQQKKYNNTLETIIYSLVELLDNCRFNANPINAYTIVPPNTPHPYLRISEILQLEDKPCFPVEYILLCSIVTKKKSFNDAFEIYNIVQEAINKYLKYYFNTQIITSFTRVQPQQITQDITALKFTLSIKKA